MKTNFKTLEEIQEFWSSEEGNHLSFCGLIDYLEKIKGEYPQRPNKPNLPQKHTSMMASEYSKELGIYEAVLLPEYQTKLKEYNTNRDLIDNLIIELIKEDSDFYRVVPLEYQSKVYSLAYQEGHSGGWSDVYNHLLDLVGIFE